jgi:putative CocE/NonD family hydrolase
MLNGDHGSQVGPEESWRDRKAWMDYWMRGVRNPYVNLKARRVSVRTLFEMHPTDKGIRSNGFKESRSFPLEDTTWTPFFLGPDATLSRTKTTPGTASYLFGTKRQAWLYEAGPEVGPPVTTAQGPDEIDFVSAPFKKTTGIAGPITANIFLESTAPDTALFVQVTDRDPQGNVSFLQRGILKASHRAINLSLSDWSTKPDPMRPSSRFLYRPWRPHVNPTLINPLEVNEYLVEIFPVAHVFRPGHSLQIKILAPPWLDSLYAYGEQTAPALNTVHFGGTTPSRITLPIVSLSGVRLGAPLACGEYHQVRCFPD